MARQGIYAIRNKVNDRCYIGSSVDVDLRFRHSHRPELRAGVHNNRYLQAAWNKYGENSFELVLIEEVADRSLLNEREQFYLHALTDLYNICLDAGRPNPRTQKNTEEHNRKISEAQKGVPRPYTREVWTGRKHKPETIEKYRQHRAGRPWSAERRRRFDEKRNSSECNAKTAVKPIRDVSVPRTLSAAQNAHLENLHQKRKGATASEECRQRMRESWARNYDIRAENARRSLALARLSRQGKAPEGAKSEVTE